MRLTGLLVAAASGALLAGCGIGAPAYPTFEQASYRIEGNTTSPGGGAATHTVIYRDGPKMRVEGQPGHRAGTDAVGSVAGHAVVLVAHCPGADVALDAEEELVALEPVAGKQAGFGMSEVDVEQRPDAADHGDVMG